MMKGNGAKKFFVCNFNFSRTLVPRPKVLTHLSKYAEFKKSKMFRQGIEWLCATQSTAH